MTDPDLLTWRKSRRSANGNCVEVANQDGSVFVRDSKNPSGPVLAFDVTVFRVFLAHLGRQR
ncbi:hypothetical protein Q0Z83_067540 [Actinoplanes sichuanensis]|uniref:DUF397 domain-containing protein n=1 Tax=Actinoplanes sichuanensis TaxID=512349 RepID=A0ABW4AC54_9ACTN|nr:DUF397 domain-containing protein [Actinoplanes sichuanensis]BEL08563.1 hypothetical protein Q0Z83_067540 [Actinoplanes sichuanensis]